MPSYTIDRSGWVELYNNSVDAVDLTCTSLDPGEGPGKKPYLLPVDTKIGAHAYLVIGECTESLSANGCLPFPIASAEETITLRLRDRDGKVIDVVSKEKSEKGTGFARIPDGIGNWQVVLSPTKGESNVPPTPTPTPTATPLPPTPLPRPTPPLPQQLRITEVYYDGQTARTEGDEFIEIQNQGTALAHLVRVRILVKGAHASSPGGYRFPPDIVLSPGDIFVIAKNARQFADRFGFAPSFEARPTGSGYVDTLEVRDLLRDPSTPRRSWALANSGAAVALVGDDGVVIDAIAYGHNPSGQFGLHGDFPAASGGQSLRRELGEDLSESGPTALQAGAPSPGSVPLPPTPTLPTPSPVPSPTPTPTPAPSPTPLPPPPAPTPTPTPKPVAPSPSPTPSPTPTPTLPTPIPTPSPSPTPLPPTPTPTVTIPQCLTDIPVQPSPRRVRVVGTVTEVRPVPEETQVYVADDCGGAILHLPIDVSAPPVGGRIRFSALALRGKSQIDLYLESTSSIVQLPGTGAPQTTPFLQAIVNLAPTGTRVRSIGNIARAKDGFGHGYHETLPSYVELNVHAPAVPVGPVAFYGILKWREAGPLLHVHYIVPAESARPTLKGIWENWVVTRAAARFPKDVIRALIARSYARGR